MSERTLVIGDIHGMYDELLRLLDTVRFSDSDRLVFLGDYINRGSRSREVVEFLIRLKERNGHVFLKGNHEDIILQLSDGKIDYWYMWLEYGEGRACIRSYGRDPDLIRPEWGHYSYHGDVVIPLDTKSTAEYIRDTFPSEHLLFFSETVLFFETEGYFFSHAGVETGMPIREQGRYSDYFLLWGDDDFINDDTDYSRTIVYGHYHIERPLIRPNRICISLNGAIAALDIDNRVIIDSKGNRTEVKV